MLLWGLDQFTPVLLTSSPKPTLPTNLASLGFGSGDMQSRFCEWADLALFLKLDRVLTLDGDAAAFLDVEEVFKSYTEDIVSPCSMCSQVVLWKTKALSHFCDALIQYSSDVSTNKYSKAMHELHGSQRGFFNDMLFLHVYTHDRWIRENKETFAFLTENASIASRNPNPRGWLPAITVSVFNGLYVKKRWYENPGTPPKSWGEGLDCGKNCCPNYSENILWRARNPGRQEGAVPFLPDGTIIPIIHFHAYCKWLVVHETYIRFWPPHHY